MRDAGVEDRVEATGRMLKNLALYLGPRSRWPPWLRAATAR